MKRSPPALWLAAQAAAFWPVWVWYAARLGDGSDEPWGVIAVVLALGLFMRLPAAVASAPSLVPGLLATLAYGAAFPFVPPLVRAAIALLALAATAAPTREGGRSPALLGLLLLSLPVIPSLQFYLGHPLRVASGEVAALLLSLSGFAVTAEGTCLRFGDQLVAIDAPCSGVRMLWGGMLLSFTLAAILRLPAMRTLALAAAAAGAVVLANGVRAAALFLPETGALLLPVWTHAAIGLVTFAGAGYLVVRAAVRLVPTEDLS